MIENGAIGAQVHPHSRVCLVFLSLFCVTPGLDIGGGGTEHCVYSNHRAAGLPSKSSPDTEGIAWERGYLFLCLLPCKLGL